MTTAAGRREGAGLMVDALERAEVPHQRLALSSALWSVEATLTGLFLRPHPDRLPRRLNLGCGDHFPPGWTNADFATPRWKLVQRSRWPDWNLDATRRWRCPDDRFEAIHCEHVLEHFSYPVALHVLGESRRALRPGGVLRLVVPDLRRFVRYYCGDPPDPGFEGFGSGAVAISTLTQCHGHRSVWDGATMGAVLEDLGFADAEVMSFGCSRLGGDVIDKPDRRWESVYVEAVKP